MTSFDVTVSNQNGYAVTLIILYVLAVLSYNNKIAACVIVLISMSASMRLWSAERTAAVYSRHVAHYEDGCWGQRPHCMLSLSISEMYSSAVAKVWYLMCAKQSYQTSIIRFEVMKAITYLSIL